MECYSIIPLASQGYNMMIATPILTIAKFTFLESIKNRLFILMLLGVISLLGLTLFITELAITETMQIQSAVMAMILRLFAVFVTCTFVITSTIREFNDRCFELIISLPLDRHTYLLGKMAGFSVLNVLIAMIMSMPLLLSTEITQLAFWCVSLICELSILTAFSLLCLITYRHVTIVFSIVAAFYFLSRTMSTIQLIAGSAILETADLTHKIMTIIIDAIALILPALEKFCRTEWLVYGGDQNLFIIGQTVIYLTLLLAAASFDLRRKNF